VTGILRAPRTAALIVIAGLVAAASLVSFCESFRGLYLWAGEHGLSGLWAAAWPLQIDTFIGVGELALFVALADSWPARSRAAAWTVTVIGLAVSVAGNVGHITGHDLASRVTAAVPPLAAAAALAVGLGVLKRTVAVYGSRTSAQPEPAAPRPHPLALSNGHAAPERGRDAAEIFTTELAAGEVPSVREIRRLMHLGQPRAQEVHSYLTALART
jgi:hypothetical protein